MPTGHDYTNLHEIDPLVAREAVRAVLVELREDGLELRVAEVRACALM